MWQQYADLPIKIDYPGKMLRPALVERLRQDQKAVVIVEQPGIICYNAYHQQGMVGANNKMFIRSGLYQLLLQMVDFLKPNFGLYLFDTYRSRQTQASLFDSLYHNIKAKRPHFDEATLQQETRKFVAHPDEPSRFLIPPHNSGGAIDLAFFDLTTGQPLDYGSAFDETEEISFTDFFEREPDPLLGISSQRWQSIRHNRRVLFHTMAHFGFTNFETEWWHYDLGDCLWAMLLNTDFLFDSMEPQVNQLIAMEGKCDQRV